MFSLGAILPGSWPGPATPAPESFSLCTPNCLAPPDLRTSAHQPSSLDTLVHQAGNRSPQRGGSTRACEWLRQSALHRHSKTKWPPGKCEGHSGKREHRPDPQRIINRWTHGNTLVRRLRHPWKGWCCPRQRLPPPTWLLSNALGCSRTGRRGTCALARTRPPVKIALP